ncbi:MAG: YlxR family protein [Actinobacteria bacterium]|nr:YlxR family protein [Actinomycetota bacterium]
MIPLRTCIGCKQIVSKDQLVRIVQINAELAVDHKNRLGSRGANIHPSLECLNWAVKTKAFYKALKFSGALNTSQVLNEFSRKVP